MLTITQETSKVKAVIFAVAVFASLATLIILGVKFHGVVKPPPARLTDGGTAATSGSKLGRYRSAAVCADAGLCASIGRTMLERGGNAVDAAITTLICDGIVNPHSMGIGGGFVMTLYNHSTGLTEALIARESAPAAASTDMYDEPSQSQIGGPAIAVPGEIPGYWAAHQRFGRLPWRALFQPAISLCRYGVPMSANVHKGLLEERIQRALHNESFHLGDIFLKNGNISLEIGDVIRRPMLATTLEKIAEGGIQAYRDLGQKLAEDIQQMGGIITHEDIKNYQPRWTAPVRVPLPVSGLTLFSVPPPASGSVLGTIMGVLDSFGLTNASMASDDAQAQTLHNITEAFKFAYAMRSRLGDPAFNDLEDLVRNMTSKSFIEEVRRRIRPDGVLGGPEEYGAEFTFVNDSGTAHVSIVDGDGSAVSVTSTVNLRFGSGFRSPQTGIILNNEMDDFSSNFTNYFGLPPSEANFIEPGKRPQSSMAPAILIDAEGQVRMVIGASGGTRITSSIAYVAARNLWMGDDIKQAVDAIRIHHQLMPDELWVEDGMPQVLQDKLHERGQPVTVKHNPLAIVCGVVRNEDGLLEANADHRKGGDVAGF